MQSMQWMIVLIIEYEFGLLNTNAVYCMTITYTMQLQCNPIYSNPIQSNTIQSNINLIQSNLLQWKSNTNPWKPVVWFQLAFQFHHCFDETFVESSKGGPVHSIAKFTAIVHTVQIGGMAECIPPSTSIDYCAVPSWVCVLVAVFSAEENWIT